MRMIKYTDWRSGDMIWNSEKFCYDFDESEKIKTEFFRKYGNLYKKSIIEDFSNHPLIWAQILSDVYIENKNKFEIEDIADFIIAMHSRGDGKSIEISFLKYWILERWFGDSCFDILFAIADKVGIYDHIFYWLVKMLTDSLAYKNKELFENTIKFYENNKDKINIEPIFYDIFVRRPKFGAGFIRYMRDKYRINVLDIVENLYGYKMSETNRLFYESVYSGKDSYKNLSIVYNFYK